MLKTITVISGNSGWLFFLQLTVKFFKYTRSWKKLIMNICISCAKILQLNFQKSTFEVTCIAYVFIHSLVHLVFFIIFQNKLRMSVHVTPFTSACVLPVFVYSSFLVLFFRWNLHIQDEQILSVLYHSLHSDRHLHMIASWSHYFIFSKAYIWGRCH